MSDSFDDKLRRERREFIDGHGLRKGDIVVIRRGKYACYRGVVCTVEEPALLNGGDVWNVGIKPITDRWVDPRYLFRYCLWVDPADVQLLPDKLPEVVLHDPV